MELKKKYDEAEVSFIESVSPLLDIKEVPSQEKMKEIIDNIIKKHNDTVAVATTYYSKMFNSINIIK